MRKRIDRYVCDRCLLESEQEGATVVAGDPPRGWAQPFSGAFEKRLHGMEGKATPLTQTHLCSTCFGELEGMRKKFDDAVADWFHVKRRTDE
jgi:hypothetical protein